MLCALKRISEVIKYLCIKHNIFSDIRTYAYTTNFINGHLSIIYIFLICSEFILFKLFGYKIQILFYKISTFFYIFEKV